jgi:hypothetical protein
MSERQEKEGRIEIAARPAKGDVESGKTPCRTHSTSTQSAASLHVTFFRNEYATSLTTRQLTLPELAELIRESEAATKAGLKWLKLAQFGNERNASRCLRHNPNVVNFSGIELDYDQEQLSFDDGVTALKAMKVRGIVYTSPSHTDAKPRWRILLPVSRPLPPSMREKFVARVNGRFGNVFAPESFVISQSYYYGRALDNKDANHRVVVIDGRFIDQCKELIEYEKKGWPEKKAPTAKQLTSSRPVRIREEENVWQRFGREMNFSEAEASLSMMRYEDKHGWGVHNTQRDVSFALVAQGVHDDDILDLIIEATMALPEARGWNRKRELRLIKDLIAGAHRRLALEQQQVLVMPCIREDEKAVSLATVRERMHERMARIFRTAWE